MQYQQSYLKSGVMDWLLEEENPSVRRFALTDLLEERPDSPTVEAARRHIMSNGPVPVILDRQNEGGWWGKPEDFYIRAKYRGTVWSFIILAELGADGNDPRIQRTCRFILDNSQDHLSGAFAYQNGAEGGGNHDGVLPCLTGNMLWALIRFGYLEDARIQKGLNWITTYQRCDDSIAKAPSGWPYDRFPKCWGRHTCHMGVIKLLRALAEVPSSQRSLAVQASVERAAEYFLAHHIFRRSHNLKEISIPNWAEFGFPLMVFVDALEVLLILAKLGYHDPRMKDAVNLVISKQNEDGRWTLERTFNGRTLARIEQKGKPSKWITLRALTALKEYNDAC